MGLTFYSRCVIGVRLGEARIAADMVGILVASVTILDHAVSGDLRCYYVDRVS